MMVRVEAIRNAGIQFDENFGAGVDNFLGDEYIFIADALKRGLQGMYLPIRVAIHPKESSGSTWGTERDLKADSADMAQWLHTVVHMGKRSDYRGRLVWS